MCGILPGNLPEYREPVPSHPSSRTGLVATPLRWGNRGLEILKNLPTDPQLVRKGREGPTEHHVQLSPKSFCSHKIAFPISQMGKLRTRDSPFSLRGESYRVLKRVQPWSSHALLCASVSHLYRMRLDRGSLRATHWTPAQSPLENAPGFLSPDTARAH